MAESPASKEALCIGIDDKGKPPVSIDPFIVQALPTNPAEEYGIGISRGSLLTYVDDLLENETGRVPLGGRHRESVAGKGIVGIAAARLVGTSFHHDEHEHADHQIEAVRREMGGP